MWRMWTAFGGIILMKILLLSERGVINGQGKKS